MSYCNALKADSLKRYLDRRLERVEQTFLSAHVH